MPAATVLTWADDRRAAMDVILLKSAGAPRVMAADRRQQRRADAW